MQGKLFGYAAHFIDTRAHIHTYLKIFGSYFAWEACGPCYIYIYIYILKVILDGKVVTALKDAFLVYIRTHI